MEGIGPAILPKFFVSKLQDERQISVVLPDCTLSKCGVYVYWHANAGESSIAKKFVDHIVSQIAMKPPNKRT
jgi:DNA-binding transcriptional LysR family regulator